MIVVSLRASARVASSTMQVQPRLPYGAAAASTLAPSCTPSSYFGFEGLIAYRKMVAMHSIMLLYCRGYSSVLLPTIVVRVWKASLYAQLVALC